MTIGGGDHRVFLCISAGDKSGFAKISLSRNRSVPDLPVPGCSQTVSCTLQDFPGVCTLARVGEFFKKRGLGSGYWLFFPIASRNRSMSCSDRFFMPNQKVIAIAAPRPMPIPQAIGVMNV